MVTSTVQQEITNLVDQFSAAFNRGDIAAVAAMYSEDAKLMPPGSDLITGRPGIQQFWQGARDSGIREATLQVLEVDSSGDLAYERGAATLKLQAGGGMTTASTVKYLVIWKRRAGGTWQLALDIWNENAPATA
jgi:uncharacterized protein (TIGR02246 family)